MDEDINSLLSFLEDCKAKDISLFDVRSEKSEEDYIVLANFSSCLENKAFAEKLNSLLGFTEFPEGYNKGEWIIFQFANIILHTFIPLKREKYNLDKLYQSFKVNLKPSKKGRDKK